MVKICIFCYCIFFCFSSHFMKGPPRDRSFPDMVQDNTTKYTVCAQYSGGHISIMIHFEGRDGKHEPRESQAVLERGSLLTICSPNPNLLFSFCHKGRLKHPERTKTIYTTPSPDADIGCWGK